MKKYGTLTLLILATATLMACGEKKHQVAMERGTAGRGGPSTGGGQANIVPTPKADLTGGIYATFYQSEYNSDPSYQTGFMDSVWGLISATDDPEAYSYVSGAPTGSESSGIFFGGLIKMVGGNVQTDGSFIQIEIRDQHTGQTAPNGNVIPPYPIKMRLVSYQKYSSSDIRMTFEDDYGQIRFIGSETMWDNTIAGSVDYQNYTSFDGGPKESGRLGYFAIDTCDLFEGLSGCN